MSSDDSLSDDDAVSLSSSSDDASEASDVETIEQRLETPKDIELNSLIVSVSFHPTKNHIAAGTVDGPVYIYSYDKDAGNMEVVSFEHNKKPCRSVCYSLGGDYLFTAFASGIVEVIDLDTYSECRKFSKPEGHGIYTMLPVTEYFLATGDDNGNVVLWDFRMQTPVACFEESCEYITSLTVDGARKTLLATSGEGMLSAFNIGSRKLIANSEPYEYDFLSCAIVKNGTKVICGAGDGSINIFNWNEFESFNDRFLGHPDSVDSIAPYETDLVLTGCEDGKIRVVQMFPNRFLGVLGSHHGFPVENIILCNDKTIAATTSHDQKIKFWDLSNVAAAKSKDLKETHRNRQVNRTVANFFADLAEG